jgi:hypothetical protein
MNTVKRTIVSILAAVAVLTLTACVSVAGNVTTEQPRNHVYGAGEPIRFLNENNDRLLLGTLTFVSVYVLSDEPFTRREFDRVGENGKRLYKDVTYEQIIQINYTYAREDGRELSEHDFIVYDSGRHFAANDILSDYGNADFEVIPTDMYSIIVALPHRSREVRVEVRYSAMFHFVLTPTATARLTVGSFGSSGGFGISKKAR